jgi:hypothetical protein
MPKSIKNTLNAKIGKSPADNSLLYRKENLPLALSGQVCMGINKSLSKIREGIQIDDIQALFRPLGLLVTYLERVKFEKPPFLVVKP